MRNPITQAERDFMTHAMVDSTRLRTALIMACMMLCDGDPFEACSLMEEMYHDAPDFIDEIARRARQQPPDQPLDLAKVIPFPARKSESTP